ncbi:MAG TPA: hypothetical protein DHW82_04700 [Spirochaetia bacterium]|nr:MAG: hypothetical protein A2Y41_08540 [Spirochaetes bacterium GWB1_36_13]HCL56293.1 hypothetical protein [Spirochaetia bacterium]
MKFEWDEKKNLSNIKKHGISFEEAAFAFSDKEAIAIIDEEHSKNEERWILLGRIKIHGIIVVVYTERIFGEIESIRIISIRKADKNEQKQYIDRLGGI